MATVTEAQPADVTELVHTHRLGVWRYLRFLGCDDAAADDLTQETFLTLTRRPPEDRGPQALASYLRQTAKSQFLNWLRKNRRQVDSPTAIDVADVAELDLAELDAADFDAADSVFREFAGDDGGDRYVEALRACVDTLDGRARAAIEGHYRDGQSRQQIADSLGMQPGGVKTLLRRTREVLRRCIERRVNK